MYIHIALDCHVHMNLNRSEHLECIEHLECTEHCIFFLKGQRSAYTLVQSQVQNDSVLYLSSISGSVSGAIGQLISVVRCVYSVGVWSTVGWCCT